MDTETIDITKELKRAKWKQRFNKAQTWWKDNRQYVMVVAPIVGVLAGKGIKAVSRYSSLRAQERIRDLRCYDASLGHYWELRRKLSNEDWLFINRQKSRGKPLGDILRDLNVLK